MIEAGLNPNVYSVTSYLSSIPWYRVHAGELYGHYGFYTPNPAYNPNTPGSTIGASNSVLVDLGPIESDSGPDPNSTLGWAWNFTKSFFGGFTIDTSPGSCLAVAINSYNPVVNALKKTQDYAKNYVAPLVPLLPGVGASIANGLYSTVQYGADRGNALEMGGAISATATFLAAQGQTAVSAIASAARNPYVALTVADAALLWGVGNEAVAAYQGKCD